jgi:hypothetical protein
MLVIVPLFVCAELVFANKKTLLQDRKVPVGTLDSAGWSAVMWGAAGGHVTTVALLNGKGASLAPKLAGWDPLMVAAVGGHHELVEWLLAKGVSISNVNRAKKVCTKSLTDHFGDFDLQVFQTPLLLQCFTKLSAEILKVHDFIVF